MNDADRYFAYLDYLAAARPAVNRGRTVSALRHAFNLLPNQAAGIVDDWATVRGVELIVHRVVEDVEQPA